MRLSQAGNLISLSQKIGSRISETESLCLKIRDLLHSNGLSEVCFPVELLARECLANAVVHGNRKAADKFIQLNLSFCDRWICLEVGDEGSGFAWQKARREEPDTATSDGRGLVLCALYADRMRFNRAGNKIALWIFRRGKAGKED